MWNTFGWGARYLVPVLPLLFSSLVLLLAPVWQRHRKMVVSLIALSVLVNLPASFVNWHLVNTNWPEATDARHAYPAQSVAAWRALGRGLMGQPLAVTQDVADDPVRNRSGVFPDLWTARLFEQRAPWPIVGAVIVCGLLALMVVSWRRCVLPRTKCA